jgi:glycoside/pentoside/hexuronide:cation symporter, GPH family
MASNDTPSGGQAPHDAASASVEILVADDQPNVSGNRSGRLPLYICLGWGVGALTTAMMANIFNLLVLRFATDYLGIAAATAGLLLAVSKLYDAVSDPVIGAVSDHWKSPRGRRRPFLLIAGFLCPLSIIALFFVPALEGQALLVYYFFALMIFSTAFGLWNVPYLAMAAEMTNDYHDRSRLVSFRVNGGALGLLLSSIGGPWLLVFLGGGRMGHQGMALTMAGLILLTSLACYFMTRDAPFTTRTKTVKLPAFHQISLVFTNGPLGLLILQKMFWYFGFAINQASLAFFIRYVAQLSDMWLGAYYMILPVGIIASQPFWLRISKVIEKKYASMIAMAIFGTLELSWLLSGPDESKILIVLRLLGLGFGAGGAILLIQSMFNDTIEYDYLRTGQRREGAFTGLFSLTEKIFSAIGVAAFGGFLGIMGYISSRGQGVVEQPDSAVSAIGIGFAVVPFCTAIASILVISMYGLSRARLKEAGGGG